MPELAKLADGLAVAASANERDVAERLVFELEIRVARLGHMPPDVFDVLIQLLRELDPKSSSAYVLLVNLAAHVWSKHTPHQRAQVLDAVRPHAEELEPFEALQAILELLHGRYLR